MFTKRDRQQLQVIEDTLFELLRLVRAGQDERLANAVRWADKPIRIVDILSKTRDIEGNEHDNDRRDDRAHSNEGNIDTSRAIG